MKIVAIIQARMLSTRLPGKVLLPFAGKPMLWYVVKRLSHAKLIDKVIVATSTDPRDNKIVDFCQKQKILYFRGSLEDVLSRYYHAAKKFKADAIVRITADCPLVDGSLIDKGIEKLIKNKLDYLSNLIERTFPRGFDFEIFTIAALEKAYKNAKELAEREHVTPYIYVTHPEEFKVRNFRQKQDKSKCQITLDTPEDYRLMKILIEKYRAHKLNFKQIIALLDQHPELVAINSQVKRKHYGQ